jgi:glyoxylase-like metal-dependent hydrolase (beta-lactamase superfamily II)
MNRRQSFQRLTLFSGLFTVLLSANAVAQSPAAAAPSLTVHPIKEGRLYWVEGGGGNSGILIGKSGVIVIDAKTTSAAGKQLVAEVAKLTSKPITHVVITHSDGDHVNGLAGFPDGIKIIAHVNNKVEQQSVYQYAAVEVDGGKCLPPKDRYPNLLVHKERTRTVIDGETVELDYFGPAHTSGDLIVYLPADKLAFTGDIITSNVLVHPEKNGSFDNWFHVANELLSLNADHYVGGHATELDTKESLRRRVADYQATRDKVSGMMDAGRSLSEIKTALGDPPKDASGCRGIPYQSLVEVAYHAHENRLQELK